MERNQLKKIFIRLIICDKVDRDINFYVILEERYTRVYNLPEDWDNIKSFKTKNKLLSKALNNKKKIEDLEEYENIIMENKND